LLKLKQGPAILIKDIIYSALHTNNDNDYTNDNDDNKRIQLYNAKNALKEFGIIQLNCEQAEEILHLRSYDTI
jgi:hypothetical protein